MEQFVKDQIKYGLKYLPGNLIKSFFIKRSSPETEAFREKEFICGTCHAHEQFDLLKEANIKWMRIDVPFPYNQDGSINPAFLAFKERARQYKENGIKIMAVTPYPLQYGIYGADMRNEEGMKKCCEITTFIFNEIKDLVGGIQITNEMGIPRFTIPFTMKEAAKFIGEQMKTLYPIKGDVLIGYNSAGPQADLHSMMKTYLKYCDYVGVDIYIGCFGAFPQGMFLYDVLLRYLWAMTKKPVILQEFGYISGGHPKSKDEKIKLLNRYGVSSPAEMKKDPAKFVDMLPEHFSEHVKKLAGDDENRYYDLLFKSDLKDHLYCELPAVTKIPGYDHTPDGQAKFYSKILKKLYKKKYLCGAIIYCFEDSEKCYICGQSDCPVETRWGLVDRQNNPKPSFYAVKEEFGKIQQK